MSTLKLKIKKTLLKRKVDGATVNGYIGRVITNGKMSFDDVVKEAGHNTTMHKAELRMAGELLLDSVSNAIKQGYIVDLGPLGTLYPAVTGTWKEKADDLSLTEMTPKVNYKPSDDIEGAVKGATLAWTTEKETDENTVKDDANTTANTSTSSSGSGSASSSASSSGASPSASSSGGGEIGG